MFASFPNGLLAHCGLTRPPEAGLGSREAGLRNGTEEHEAGWVAAGAEIQKYSFGTPGDSGAVRVPPACQAVGEGCVPAFAMVILPI